ncbi:MAG: DEAD/DEAH box helicase, partial [Deltaproteobacteria bacterium]
MASSDTKTPGLRPVVRRWFESSFAAPTRAQALGWPPILAGRSTLLLAPTGSGKTLAAFLTSIDRLMFNPAPEKKSRCRVLYVSPMKALAVDVERNLRAPIAGIAAQAERDGEQIHMPVVGIRTGDTPAKERAQMLRAPPDILITTPESLYLLLTSQSREILRSVDTVIVDEIHALVSGKRGAHLFLSLERVEALRTSKTPLQRIGLSATQRPLRWGRAVAFRPEVAAAAGRDRRCRQQEGVRPASRGPGRGPRQDRESGAVDHRAGRGPAKLDLAVDPSPARRADPGEPLDDDLRELAAAVGAPGRRHQRGGARGDRPRPPRQPRQGEAAGDRGSAEARKASR